MGARPRPWRFLMLRLTPLDRRRIANFRANKRAIWSLRIFSVLFILSLCANLIANDKPLVVSFQGEMLFPVFANYDEARFGGEDGITGTDFHDPFVTCLIVSGASEACYDDEIVALEQADQGIFPEDGTPGWILRAPIPFDYSTVDYDVATAPSAPDSRHWLGTDDQGRSRGGRPLHR